jgi:hypothetical protein
VDGSQKAVAAFNADVSGNVIAGVVNTTDLKITNYNPREYQDPRYVLNSPELSSWREGLSDEWADTRYRFVFVSRVTDGDELNLTFKRSADVDANANIVKVGEYKFKVQYDGSAGTTIKAQNGPLTVDPTIYSFRIDRSKKPYEYRFYRDLNNSFSFQRVTKA